MMVLLPDRMHWLLRFWLVTAVFQKDYHGYGFLFTTPVFSPKNQNELRTSHHNVRPVRHYYYYQPTTARQRSALSGSSAETTANDNDGEEEVVDVVVIGAGIGGLSCAALSAKYGLKTLCVEAHDTAGGVAHSFERYSSASKTVPFCFDSGPSLISGLSQKGTNPLRQVLDAVGTSHEIQFQTYDGWMVHDLADGKKFKVTTGGGDEFAQALQEKSGLPTRQQFEQFKDEMLKPRGLSEASTYIPPFALRGGVAAVASLARYMLKLLSMGTKGTYFTGPFTKVMDDYSVTDEFLRKWFDYLAFALSGLDAAHTQAAPVLYMMRDLHSPNAVLDYPMGGMGALIDALVSGLTKHGGELRVNSRVEQILLSDSTGKAKCEGVVLNNGKVIRALRGVVCNAPLWNMARILQDSVHDNDDTNDETAVSKIQEAVEKIQASANDMCMTGSFMHLHLGIPADGLLSNTTELECHHSVLDFSIDVTAEQNMVIISIPTVFDPSLAPEGYHVIHAYTAACDSFDPWESFLPHQQESGKVGRNPNAKPDYRQPPQQTPTDGGTASSSPSSYEQFKEEKAQVLWKAVECVIPDIRERAQRPGSIALVGTPLTHRRYNQRFRGTYGPAPKPGKDVWELGGATTPIRDLFMCGDTTFPGIGLPGVAASGTIAANTMVSVSQQTQLMTELQNQGALQ